MRKTQYDGIPETIINCRVTFDTAAFATAMQRLAEASGTTAKSLARFRERLVNDPVADAVGEREFVLSMRIEPCSHSRLTSREAESWSNRSKWLALARSLARHLDVDLQGLLATPENPVVATPGRIAKVGTSSASDWPDRYFRNLLVSGDGW